MNTKQPQTPALPGSLAEKMLADFSTSFRLKATLGAFLDADPVDALHDAQALLAAMADHYARISSSIEGGR